MKIDLHIHTKKIKDGEPKERNISSKELIDKLNDNNIGIAAITNHCYFDVDQFLECVKYIDDQNLKNKIMLLPGVELDVFFNNERKQLNLIIPFDKFMSNNEEEKTKYLNDFKKCIEEFEKSNDKKEIKDLHFFSEYKDILIYLDNKGHLTSWNEENIEKIKHDLDKFFKEKPAVILDVNKRQAFLRLRANNLNGLIGSDIRNWNEYEKNSQNLIDISVEINSFSQFLKCVAYNDNASFLNLFDSLNDVKEIKNLNFDIDDKNKISIDNLKIYNGVNIIFGPKASGKTKILEAIMKQENIEKNSNYYSSSKHLKIKNKKFVSDILDEYISKSCEIFKNNEKILTKTQSLKEKIDFLLNYNDISFDKWTELFDFVDCNIGKNFLEIFNTKKVDIYEKYSETKKIINEIKNSIDEIENIDSKYFSKDIEDLKRIKINIIKFFIEKMKSYWKMDLFKGIKSQLNTFNKKWSGKSIYAPNIKLFERYNNRKKLKNTIKEIQKNNDWNTQKEIQTEIDLEERGKIKIILKHQSINFSDIEETKKLWDNKILDWHQKTECTNFLEKINNYKSDNDLYSSIKDEKIKKFLKKLNENLFSNNYYIVDSKNNKIELSSGELAILSMWILFDDDKEYYFLDEPESYLNSSNIFNFLIEKIWEKKKLNKKIIICTHNPLIAINSIPFNMIYRRKDSKNEGQIEYDTFIGNPWTNKFTNIKNKNEVFDFIDILIKEFEYDIKHFNFRKGIYENE